MAPKFSDYVEMVDENFYLSKIERYKAELKEMEKMKFIIYSKEAEEDMMKFETDDVYYYIEPDEDEIIY